MVTEYGGTTPPVEGTNCAKSASVTRHLGQSQAEDGSGPRFDPDFMHPEYHVTACKKPQNAQQPSQTTQQRNDTMKALREEDIPGTPGLPAPGFGEQFFQGQNATDCLPQTPLPPPKA